VPNTVSASDLRLGLRDLGLSERPVCAHSSLSSFGRIEGGADAVVDAFLAERCTLLVPSFSWEHHLAPPAQSRPARNAFDYDHPPALETPAAIFDANASAIDRAMGAVAQAVVRHPARARGRHPLCSFSAVGPAAEEIVRRQQVGDVYAPLRALARWEGFVLLMGVGLTTATLLHLAEQTAGRTLFRRWALDAGGETVEVEVGSCSRGFERFTAVLSPVERRTTVGPSSWRAFPAADMLILGTEAIRADPEITRCAEPGCQRCEDAIAGGPVGQFSAYSSST
jgi:aminoglycoside N3'-acetyltransferase